MKIIRIEGDTIPIYQKIGIIIPIDKGELFIMPTDTLWGICVSPIFTTAVSELFKIKGREIDQPLPLLTANIKFAEELIGTKPSKIFFKLAEKFWPGALTIIIKSRKEFVEGLYGPGNTIGLRIPAHPIAREIIEASRDKYLAATSANRHGKPVLKTIDELKKEFESDVFMIIESNLPMMNNPSTVVDMSSDKVRIVREGAISEREIFSVIQSTS
jgi:L-threonylcarbamoyladenylate synthase